MIVCICKGLSEQAIRDMVEEGHGSVQQLSSACGAGSECGSCRFRLNKLVKESSAEPAIAESAASYKTRKN